MYPCLEADYGSFKRIIKNWKKLLMVIPHLSL
jgi:hypothetical protein